MYKDGEQIEPKFFIPTVPMLLLNGCDGVGNGFKSSILNYSLEEIVNSLLEMAKHNKVITSLTPHLNGWHGDVQRIDGQTIFRGRIEKISASNCTYQNYPHAITMKNTKNFSTI